MKIIFRQILTIIISLLSMFTLVNAQWQQTNSKYSGQIKSLSIIGNNIYAGTNKGLIYSTDDGVRWETLDNGLPESFIKTIALSQNKIFLLNSEGVLFSSNDSGLSWEKSIDFNNQAYSLASNSNVIIVGKKYGITVSSDEGQSWSNISLPVEGRNSRISTITINENEYYVGSNYAGLFYSSDGGLNWKSINNGISDLSIISLFIDNNNIYMSSGGGGLYYSSNKGASWKQINNGLTNLTVLCFAKLKDKIFAGTLGGGIYFTSDNGLNWEEFNGGLGYESISSIVTKGNNIYAGSSDGGGVFLLNNTCTNWEPLIKDLTYIPISSFTNIGIKFFVGTSGGGVFVFSNSENMWKTSNYGLTNKIITSLNVKDSLLYATTFKGIFCSSDSGLTWDMLNKDFSNLKFTSLAIDASTMYAGSYYNGIFISSNNGLSWSNSINNICNVNSIAIKDHIVFAATGCGILRSSNYGMNWSISNDGLAELARNIKSIKACGSKMFAATSNGFYFSNNNGDNWNLVDGLPIGNYVAIEIFDNNIFVSATSFGIFYSKDNGSSWLKINENLAYRYPDAYSNVNSLFVYGNYLYAGMNDEGLWRRDLANIIISFIQENKISIPSTFSMGQNFPNPFNPSTSITYEIPKSSFVTLEVYDILGRNVATLVREYKTVGKYNVEFNAEKLSSGIYLYTLRTNNFIQTKKMILLR